MLSRKWIQHKILLWVMVEMRNSLIFASSARLSALWGGDLVLHLCAAQFPSQVVVNGVIFFFFFFLA